MLLYTFFCANVLGFAEEVTLPPQQAESIPIESVDNFKPLGPPTLEQLDNLFPKATRPQTRNTPRSARAPKEDGSASDVLAQMLLASDPAVRVRAVEGISREPAGDAVPLLMIALADSDAEVRTAAGRALASMPGEALVESVVGALGWGDPMVARAVGAALPDLRYALEGPLLARFESSESPRIERMAAAYCLGRIRSTRSGPHLVKEVWGDDLVLALYCADALAMLDDPGLLRDQLRMASHPQVQMRVAAYRGLARTGGDDARRTLIEAASGRAEPDTSARKTAIRLLAYVPNDEIVEFLMALVRADTGLVGPSSDALAVMFGLPQGMHRGLWLDWYKKVYTPTKPAGVRPDTARASTSPDADVPIGFPENGFPFLP